MSLRLESLAAAEGVLSYKLTEKASGTGTRESGERLRTEIVNLHIETNKIIEVDFGGISVVSSSFADQLVGKLVLQLGFAGFVQAIRLSNMNDFVQAVINRSVQQRLGEGSRATVAPAPKRRRKSG